MMALILLNKFNIIFYLGNLVTNRVSISSVWEFCNLSMVVGFVGAVARRRARVRRGFYVSIVDGERLELLLEYNGGLLRV